MLERFLVGGTLTANTCEAHTLTADTSRTENCWSKPGSSNQSKSEKSRCTWHCRRTEKKVTYVTQTASSARLARGNCHQPTKAATLTWCDCEAQPAWATIIKCFSTIFPYSVARRHLACAADRVVIRLPGNRRSVTTLLGVPRHRSTHPRARREQRPVQIRLSQRPNPRDMDLAREAASPARRCRQRAGTETYCIGFRCIVVQTPQGT